MSSIYLLYTGVVMLLLAIVAFIVTIMLSVTIVSVIPSTFFTNQVAFASESFKGGEGIVKIYEHYEQFSNGEYQ